MTKEEASERMVESLKPGNKLTARRVSECLGRLNSGAFRPARQEPRDKDEDRGTEARPKGEERGG